jgi:hypothetical protein
MTRRKLKIPKLQNTKTKTFKVHKKKGKYPFSPVVKLPTKLKSPKMIKKSFKISKLQNTKTKNLQSSQENKQLPSSPLVKLHTQKN